MTVPGAGTRAAAPRSACGIPVGVITAAAYVATIDCPERFSSAKDIGPYLGLTPRRYQSGETSIGPAEFQNAEMLCCERFCSRAAHVLLTRTRRKSALRTWAWRVQREP